MRSYKDHSNNTDFLTLPANGSYQLKNNRGSITTFPNCIIKCKNNYGSISIGGNSTIENCSNNHGTICIEPDCRILKANHNYATIKIGSQACIENIDTNSGNIEVGDYSTISSVHNNTGVIRVGLHCNLISSCSKSHTGQILISSLSDSKVALSVDKNGVVRVNSRPAAGAGAGAGLLSRGDSISSEDSGGSTYSLSSNSYYNPAAAALSNLLLGVGGSGETSPTGLGPVQLQGQGVSTLISEDNNCGGGGIIGNISNGGGADNVCPICLERRRNFAFLCGHTCCDICVQGLTICHLCRAPIERKIKLFL